REDTRRLKEEMATFKDEMRAFKDRMEQNVRENNKQWGALANKMGTLVEDIIFPATRPVIQSVFGVEVKQIAMRVMRQKDREREEFDVVAVSETQAFLIEVKSSPRSDDLKDFAERKSQAFLRLFPEYQSLKLILIVAALSFPEDVVRQATERGVFAMAYREWEYMDILNAKELLPQS
ncbi:MAG: hypothetical protein RMM16_11085, partial [Chloroherpetonaceae bacterium]|nr:hypothetical protein [Chloroherpetonaceae bacterium]